MQKLVDGQQQARSGLTSEHVSAALSRLPDIVPDIHLFTFEPPAPAIPAAATAAAGGVAVKGKGTAWKGAASGVAEAQSAQGGAAAEGKAEAQQQGWCSTQYAATMKEEVDEAKVRTKELSMKLRVEKQGTRWLRLIWGIPFDTSC